MGYSAVGRLGVIATGIIGSFTLAAGANAAVTITGIALDTPGGVNGTITYTPPNPDYVVTAGIGRIKLTTSTGDTLLSYCIDIFHSLKTGSFTAQAMTPAVLTADKSAKISALLSNGEAAVTDANHSAAQQLAIWEIVNEGSGSYSITSGDLQVAGLSSAVSTLANSYVSNVASGLWAANPNLALAVLKSDNNQTQLVWGTTANRVLGAVPEPATWAMMLVGFGAVGTALRGRKTPRQVRVTFG